jgi:hypothetical protein
VAPVVLVTGMYMAAVAIDSTYVYWTQSGGQSGQSGQVAILRMPKAGGAPTAIYTTLVDPNNGFVGPTGIIVDDTSVYFGSIPGETVEYSKAAKDGSTATGGAVVIGQPTSLTTSGDFATDSTNLYFDNTTTMSSVPLVGGPVHTVVNGTGPGPVDPVLGMAIGFPGINGRVSDGTNVYYAAGGGPGILGGLTWLLSVPVGGGVPAILVPAQTDANGNLRIWDSQFLAVNGGFLYWATITQGIVYKLSVQGGDPVTLATNASISANCEVVTDGINVYYFGSDALGGGLWRVPVGGGTSVKLVSGASVTGYGFGNGFNGIISDMAVDDTSVYAMVAYQGGQALIKVAK